MKLICPNCGTKYERGKFCPECGSPLSVVTIKKALFCPICQTELPSGKFCPECGAKLEEREIEVGAETKDTILGVESSAQIIESGADPEIEAILAKYRDEFGDIRELNKEEYAIAAEELDYCAKQGNLEGMCFLASLYINGYGVERDVTKAFKLVCEADKKGSMYASAILGIFYAFGIIVEEDLDEAIRRFTEGYRQTKIPGFAGLAANSYFEKKEYDNVLKFAQIAANNGDKQGFKTLGDLYLHGLGVKKNDQRAFENYMQAAALGEESAINQIGWMYQKGRGIEEDQTQAFFWYNEAAQKGSEVGMHNLAFCYQEGYGVEQDAAVAVEWFKKAAEAGFVESMLELSKYYQETFFDLGKAKMWLLKAIDLGNIDALNMLGNLYANSSYSCYDPIKAFEWYKKAVNANCVEAMWNLACAYSNGTGCERDIEKAEEWLKKAADYGHELAMNKLEELVEKKKESQKSVDTILDEAVLSWNNGDHDTAYKIWENYANLGNPRAMSNIASSFIHGLYGPKDTEKADEMLKKIDQTGYNNSFVTKLQFNLALMYMKGDCTQVNIPKFQEWMQTAMKNGIVDKLIEEGDSKLLDEMGAILVDGKNMGAENNIFIDYERGFTLHKKAADLGNLVAMTNVGWCYEFGRGTAIDANEAMKWYKKAIKKGYKKDEWITESIKRCKQKSIPPKQVKIHKAWATQVDKSSIMIHVNIEVNNLRDESCTLGFTTEAINSEDAPNYGAPREVIFNIIPIYDSTIWSDFQYTIKESEIVATLNYAHSIDTKTTIWVKDSNGYILASYIINYRVAHEAKLFKSNELILL